MTKNLQALMLLISFKKELLSLERGNQSLLSLLQLYENDNGKIVIMINELRDKFHLFHKDVFSKIRKGYVKSAYRMTVVLILDELATDEEFFL